MAEKTVREQLDESVKELFEKSEAELELELGRRLTQTEREIQAQGMLTTAQATGKLTADKETLQALPDFVRKVAHRFLENFNGQMYALVCDRNDPENAKILEAVAAGAQSLGLVLSGVFVATFGWLPGVAAVIAVIVAKRFGKSGYDAVCKTWKEQLG
jgi:hypothetical protein